MSTCDARLAECQPHTTTVNAGSCTPGRRRVKKTSHKKTKTGKAAGTCACQPAEKDAEKKDDPCSSSFSSHDCDLLVFMDHFIQKDT